MLWAARPGWEGFKTTLSTSPGPALFFGGLIFAHIFVLAILSDVLGVQGDRIFGRPTLPSHLSGPALNRLLHGFLAVWALGLAAGIRLNPPLLTGLLLLSGPLYNLPLVRRLVPGPGRRGLADLPDYRFEALLFGQLPASGFAFWLCS
jgi:4-hydroxybenzoate polyprenyltransferase